MLVNKARTIAPENIIEKRCDVCIVHGGMCPRC
jgi:hypothetical protein